MNHSLEITFNRVFQIEISIKYCKKIDRIFSDFQRSMTMCARVCFELGKHYCSVYYCYYYFCFFVLIFTWELRKMPNKAADLIEQMSRSLWYMPEHRAVFLALRCQYLHFFFRHVCILNKNLSKINYCYLVHF